MKKTLDQLLKEKIVILDGATGTNLQKRGMPGGVCPEQWIIEHPEALAGLQKEYVLAGSDMVYAPTFSANAIKLAEYGLEAQVGQINRRLVEISRDAVGEDILVAGDMTMTGQQLEPMGTLTFEALVHCYEQQARALADAGVDVFIVETMMSLQETRAAVIAIHNVCELPVMVTMTFDESGHTLYGTDSLTALTVLQNLGVAAFGMNCSCGPEHMAPMLDAIKPYAKVPLIVKANAGLPKYVDGQTVFSMEPENFARENGVLVQKGADMVGGCCGTTPEHIRALSEALHESDVQKRHVQDEQAGGGISLDSAGLNGRTALTNERKTWFFDRAFEGVRVNTVLDVQKNDKLEADLAGQEWDTFYDCMDDIADDAPDVILICPDSDKVDGRWMMRHILMKWI